MNALKENNMGFKEADKQSFLEAYIEALIWSTTDMDTEQPIECSFSEFNLGLQARCVVDCNLFIQMAASICPDWKNHWSMEQAGHDFALTRNHHGSGFWDRYSKKCEEHVIGEKLTEISHKFEEINIYIGDDNLVYC
jgi:hypothetical protein